MKHVLIALKNMNIGGVEKSLLSLLNTIEPNQYEVDLLLLERSGDFLDEIPSWVNVLVCNEYSAIRDEVNLPPIKVILNYFKKLHWGRAWKLGIAYIKTKFKNDYSYYYQAIFRGIPVLKKQYDIAISYTSIISYLTWYVLYHVQAKQKIGWIHFDVSKITIDRSFMRKLHEKMDRIYVVSEQALQTFRKKFPELEEKTELRYNIINKQQILRLAEERSPEISQKNQCTIVTLGRLSVEKGQDIIPSIAACLRDRGYRFRWYLIGDGNLRKDIEADILEKNLQEYIILLGTQKNPYPFLKQADLYVQPSVHEGYCITLAEACVFGMPIVATDFSGAREQLQNRDNCYVTARTVGDLVKAISEQMERLNG